MTGQQLKNSILQWAIQGKLVPQIASEGTADDLLKEIRAEKERLVKEGKLKKKDLEVKPIEDNEIPFEVPEGWRWVRIGDVFLHASGKQLAGGKDKGTPRKYITTSNLYWNRFVLGTVKTMCFTDEEVETSSATKGDLLVCEGGAGYGRSAIWSYDYDICLQNHIHRLRPIINGLSEYVYYIMYLLKESNQIDSVGTAMPGLSAGKLKSIAIPLPPLSEQKRIVAKIEELMPLVEQYGKAQEQLEALNKELPEKLKKSVLQEAIMGKLVPQDPKEGTADEMLAEIRKEKEKLVKEGKLKKKDLEVKPIEEDEVPFEIPEGWRWCRWGDLSFSIQYGFNAPAQSSGTIKMVRISDIHDNKVSWDSVPYCEIKDLEIETYKLQVNDILFARTGGTVGKSFLVTEINEDAVYAGYLIRTRFSKNIFPKYAKIFMETATYWEQLREGTIATAQPNCNGQTLSKMMIPIPPLSEQKRIVAKVEEVMGELDKMVEMMG